MQMILSFYLLYLLYLPLHFGNDSISSLLACLKDIREWLDKNFKIYKVRLEVIYY